MIDAAPVLQGGKPTATFDETSGNANPTLLVTDR